MAQRKRKFLQRARESMERRGTVGSFGKATASKIRKVLRSRDPKQRRRAAFAKAARTIARRRHRSRR